MSEKILAARGRQIIELPIDEWQHNLSGVPEHAKAELAFMSAEHHLVRNFVVRELPNVGKPLSPEFIAQELALTVDRVNTILDELEEHMTFLFRNDERSVIWAYPVTVDRTPHHITFDTGEQIYAA
jgi:hypothetical protein